MKIDEAIQAFETALNIGGRDPITLACLGMTFGSAGRLAEAKTIPDELNKLAQEKYVRHARREPPCTRRGLHGLNLQVAAAYGVFTQNQPAAQET